MDKEALNQLPQRIVDYCHEIDVTAAHLYQRLAQRFPEEPLKTFFQNLHQDELMHVAYWNQLKRAIASGSDLNVLPDMERVLFEIENLFAQIKGLSAEILVETDLSQLLAKILKLEYVILHPSFISLFEAAGNNDTEQPSMDEGYQLHLQRICSFLNSQGSENPILPLLGELLCRVWQETRSLLKQNQSDALTGILNRRGFQRQLKPLLSFALRRKLSLALMIIDIDHFKEVNDRLGHQAGDKLLRQVAQAISQAVRASDLVARWGGDEFLVFLLDVKTFDCERVAQKIQADLKKSLALPVKIGVSIGIGLWKAKPFEKPRLERLIAAADEALYEVKKSGRGSSRLRLI